MDFSLTDVFNLFDILRRASAHQALTPSERAWVKAWKGVIQAVLVALLLALAQYLSTRSLSAINVRDVADVLGAIAFKALLDARAKFFTAQSPVEVQTGQLLASVAQPSSPAPVVAPVAPVVAAPAPAPVSGGADLPPEAHFPTNPMLKNVPLPRAQRSNPDVRH